MLTHWAKPPTTKPVRSLYELAPLVYIALRSFSPMYTLAYIVYTFFVFLPLCLGRRLTDVRYIRDRNGLSSELPA